VYTLWHAAWLEEFTCDAIGTFLTGPAYAWQHLGLCARRGGGDPYASVASHPADHARAALIRTALERLSFDGEAQRFEDRWRELRGAWEQPLPAGVPGLGRPAVKDPDFWSRYPVLGGQRLTDRVVDECFAGLHALGLTPCPVGADPATSIRALLLDAWRRYEADPSAFVAGEQALITQLRSLL
jgi:hypothetical protein